MFRNTFLCHLASLVLVTAALLGCEAAVARSGFETFDFPARSPIARLSYGETTVTKAGKQVQRRVEIKAQGRVQLPSDAAIDLKLTFDGLQSLASFDQLSKVRINNINAANLDLEDSHLLHFKNLSPVLHMNLDTTLLTDKALPTIGTFKNLIDLRLSGTDIKGNGFENLDKLSKLSRLNISSLNLAPGSLTKLRPLLPQLVDFDVSRTDIGKEDCACLAQLKSVEALSCSLNRKIDDSCVSYLGGLSRLKYLTINDTSITDKSLPILLKLPALTDLVIRAREFWRSGHPQKQIGHIRFIDVSAKIETPVEVFEPLH